MKHSTSSVTSGTLPVTQNSQRRYSTTSGSASRARTTSTTGLRHAGAKKWVTVARALCFRPEKIRAAGSELVLDVISVSADTSASTCTKIFCLSARSSVAASSTQSAPPIAL